jgi:hypothetical protein
METLMATGFAHPELIIETDWLAWHLDDPKVCVVDCTTHLLPRPGNVLYDIKPGREIRARPYSRRRVSGYGPRGIRAASSAAFHAARA